VCIDARVDGRLAQDVPVVVRAGQVRLRTRLEDAGAE
jgi:hypothetical protein